MTMQDTIIKAMLGALRASDPRAAIQPDLILGGCTIDGEFDLAAVARAILIAMRKPSPAMILACADIPWSQQDMWERSIDAALRDSDTHPEGEDPEEGLRS